MHKVGENDTSIIWAAARQNLSSRGLRPAKTQTDLLSYKD